MPNRLKRRLQVQELLFSGYTQEKISEKLKVSLKTIGRDIKWIRRNAQNWLDDIAKTNFVNVFRETLEGYRQDIVRLYEMLEKCKDDKTKIKLIKTISDIRYRYAGQFVQFPVVWSMDVYVKKNNPHLIEEPEMRSIYGDLAN